MKILFASDFSVSAFENLPTKEEMHCMLNGVKSRFEETDFSIVNLECVLYEGDSQPIVKSGPNIKGNPEFVEMLNYLNIDVAGLANNHAGDFGDEALINTMNLLEKNGIAYIGAGKSIKEAYLPYIFEKDDLKVAVIAACENEFGVATETTMGSAGFNLLRLANAIKSASEESDKVIVYFHGGNERNPFPSPEKTQLYRLLIDLGADGLIAMHTHSPQGYEIYNGKPIVYSMGNFFFPKKCEDDTYKTNPWYFGYLTELNITNENIELEIIPYRSTPLGMMEGTQLILGEEKQSFMHYLEELTEPISSPEKLQYYFNIWCSIEGVMYAQNLNYSKEMESNNTSLCRHLKNALSCEAHNELIKNTLNLCYFDELDKYKNLQSKLQKYQHVNL